MEGLKAFFFSQENLLFHSHLQLGMHKGLSMGNWNLLEQKCGK